MTKVNDPYHKDVTTEEEVQKLLYETLFTNTHVISPDTSKVIACCKLIERLWGEVVVLRGLLEKRIY